MENAEELLEALEGGVGVAEVSERLGAERVARINRTSKLTAALLMSELHPTITSDKVTKKISDETILVFKAMYGVSLGRTTWGSLSASRIRIPTPLFASRPRPWLNGTC